ncbi:VanZ family protein [Alysiella filiformis]|uniref:VanZ like family protein n=1 Tax=Alysiella filiformis DSM 16848 TaxID=1120981 RepID=A0A286EBM1_9NEIS|nr:VanZ family protein [Alysiella filiformis]QMT31284.1 VanZ family protein [Alysiella filiformis]UBQ55712.1 VanZ family protein [Alysiella filiformis DSM 16848]SOD68276.1 VanZ like family protein [Alysiella filiformis DSM 16848]
MTLPKNKWLLFALIWLGVGVYGLIFRESTGSHAAPFPHFDKMAHGMLFFVQMCLICKAYLQENQTIALRFWWLFALAYAGLSEWAQAAFTTTRQADVWDALADMVGASCALYLGNAVQQVRKNRVNTKT